MTITFIVLTMIKAGLLCAQGGIVIAYWKDSKKLINYLPIIILIGILVASMQMFINESILINK